MTYPAEVLRKPAEPVTKFDGGLKRFVRNMFDTMRAAPGVGLAAPQVNASLQVLVMEPGPEYPAMAMVNPVIVEREGSLEWEEGCLSIPGYFGFVERAARIKVRYQDEKGGAHQSIIEGFPAIVVQHEIDHLRGVLFVDYLSKINQRRFERSYGKDPYRWKYGQGK